MTRQASVRAFCLVGVGLAIGVLGMPSNTLAGLISSFESGDLDGWSAGENNGALTVVNSNRASDGVFSTESTFTVPAGYAGWGVHTLISKSTAEVGITPSTTEVSLDAFADWSNPNAWGVYGNNIWLILNYEGTWATIEPSSGGLTDGTFTTLTYDISAHAAAMSNPALSYSTVEVAWFLGTWADDGLDNGVQTISIDNINLVTVPEPASVALLASCAAGILISRRPRLG